MHWSCLHFVLPIRSLVATREMCVYVNVSFFHHPAASTEEWRNWCIPGPSDKQYLLHNSSSRASGLKKGSGLIHGITFKTWRPLFLSTFISFFFHSLSLHRNMRLLLLIPLIGTVANAATITFRVVAPGATDVQVSVNGQLTKLSASDPDVPYFVGQAEANDQDKYQVYTIHQWC